MQTLNHLVESIQAFENEKYNNLSQESLSLSSSLSFPFKENHLCFTAFRTMNLISMWALSHFILSPYILQFFIARE